MKNRLNKTLGELVMFVSEVAISARMNTAYNPVAIHNPDSPVAAMWLTDMLHSLYGLGEAIKEQNKPLILLNIEDIRTSWANNRSFIERALLTNVHNYHWDVDKGLKLLNKLESNLHTVELYPVSSSASSPELV